MVVHIPEQPMGQRRNAYQKQLEINKKWKYNIPKPMGYDKNISKIEVQQ